MPRHTPKARSAASDTGTFHQQLDAARMASLPSVWATRKRYIANSFTLRSEPWSFRYREWQRQIMDDLSPRVVIEKAAQMGLTEVAMSRAMHSVDARGTDVLYLFPTVDAAGDFSAARFDVMLQESPELRALFSDVSNVGLKRAGPTNLYFRGSNSRTGLKSIPVGALVIDEFEEMVTESVVLVRKRLLGHANTWELNLSTPQYPETGIDAEFQSSDQHHWWMPCPHCGKHQALELEANLVVPGDWDLDGAHWKCAECDEPWTEEQRLALLDRGEWRAAKPGARVRGYHVSQLMSPIITAPRLAGEWEEAHRSASHMEDFHNSLLGLPYQAEGVKLTRGVIERCMGSFQRVERATCVCAVGIDVGAVNHYVVLTRMPSGRVRLLTTGRTDWAGCDMLMQAFRPEVAIIDAAPERNLAAEFRDRWEGQVYLAFYPNSEYMQGQHTQWDDERLNVSIHRTALADLVAATLLRGEVELPSDTPREAVRHLSAVYRAMETQTDGRERARWKARGPDHTFHAMIYGTVALERCDDADLSGLTGAGSGAAPDYDPAWVELRGEGGGFPSMDDGAFQ